MGRCTRQLHASRFPAAKELLQLFSSEKLAQLSPHLHFKGDPYSGSSCRSLARVLRVSPSHPALAACQGRGPRVCAVGSGWGLLSLLASARSPSPVQPSPSPDPSPSATCCVCLVPALCEHLEWVLHLVRERRDVLPGLWTHNLIACISNLSSTSFSEVVVDAYV